LLGAKEGVVNPRKKGPDREKKATKKDKAKNGRWSSVFEAAEIRTGLRSGKKEKRKQAGDERGKAGKKTSQKGSKRRDLSSPLLLLKKKG